jgi:microtubule-associated protein tau
LQNAAYKPGGGDKKIETVKLDFKEKAKPKVASTVNITHKPGGGVVKVT